MTPTRKRRAPKGGVEARTLLRLPESVDVEARKAAKRRGLSYAEWLRRAVEARVLTQKAQELGVIP